MVADFFVCLSPHHLYDQHYFMKDSCSMRKVLGNGVQR